MVVKVLFGEFYVLKIDELIIMVFGLCIVVCIYDEGFGIGGMNYFMLLMEKGVDLVNVYSLNCCYGNWVMEYLINEILKNGVLKCNLKVKLFGGGKIICLMIDIGVGNICFVNVYIFEEGLDLVFYDVGGFWF